MFLKAKSHWCLVRISKIVISIIFTFIFLFSFAQQERVQVINKPLEKKVDVMVEGKLFTSYVYGNLKLKKPVLYPIITAHGAKITRSFPLEKTPDERLDNPSQSGLFVGFGDLDGLDFWNFSSLTSEDKKEKMGIIRHAKILKTKNGAEAGGLEVAAEWEKQDSTPVLFQNTKYIFRASGNTRIIDIVLTFSALDEAVIFNDNTDGLLGLRVCKELEAPSNQPVIRTTIAGLPSENPSINKIATGSMIDSEGFTGENVKGKKAKWVRLTGKIKNDIINVVILDHPMNIQNPSYWNVNGEGLLAVNPLAGKSFGGKYLGMEIPAGNTAIFRYRIIIQSRSGINDTQINAEYEKFSTLK